MPGRSPLRFPLEDRLDLSHEVVSIGRQIPPGLVDDDQRQSLTRQLNLI